MFIEQPPFFYRLLFPGAIWKKPGKKKCVYLTFDDGPIPEVTPWVLDILDKYDVKATFFMVGDNVRKHPDIFRMVVERGHSVGNHTFNHIQGLRYLTRNYLKNVEKASELMLDVVTRDYNSVLSPEQVLNNVKRYTRNGSIIVFHDSLKAEKNMREAMPKAIEWLKSEGYDFLKLTR